MNDSTNKKHPNVQHYADGTASVMRKAVMTEWFGKNERFDRLHRFCHISQRDGSFVI